MADSRTAAWKPDPLERPTWRPLWLEAALIMRIRPRGSPSWPGTRPETGYVEADW